MPIGAGALVLALAGSVWALTLRERANKRLFLEYEVYKSASALTDLVRLRSLSADDLRDVIAFGLYKPDGSALSLFGDAPTSMEPLGPMTPTSRFTVGDSSVVLIRTLGADLPGRRMMSGMERGWRMRGGQGGTQGAGQGAGQRPGPSGAGAIPPPLPDIADSAIQNPALSYVEVSTVGFKAEEAVLLAIAAVATIALGGLYAVIVAMNRRYAASMDREARDRELVELGQAARTIAHEIKNPLGVIRIQCGILRKGATEAAAAGLSIIDDEAMRLAELADRIRRFLKSGEESASRVSASRFIGDFVGRYSGAVDSDIAIPESEYVTIDEARMIEALDNVVANAIEASAGVEERPRVEARARHGRLVVSVLDRGPGMPPSSVGRAFEPFFTTKEKGSGLGLALARKNVESFGGSVSYADRPGGGAAFTVSLPLA